MSTSHETVDNAGSECEQPTSPTRTTSLCAPTSGASHVDPTAGTTSSVCEPDASTSVASDLVDMDRRRLPFPPMRQTVDPDKQKKLRALTGLGANNQNGGSTNGGGGGSSRHGGSSVGRGSRSQKSTSTGGGVKPYRAPVSVSVGGVNLGTITSIGSPITVDPATGQPTIVVGRPSTPNTRGSATTPMSWQLTQPFDSDANDVVVPPAATAAATAAVVSPPPSLVRCRDGSPVLQPDQPTSPPSEPEALPQPQPEQPQQLQAVPPATAENTRKTASAPNSASKAKKPPVSAATGRGQNKASTTEQTSPDRGHPSASAASAVSNNSSPMKPLRLGSTIGSDDDTDGRRDLRASESHASLELLASQNGADRDAIFRTLHRDASSGDLDSATSELSASSPPANSTFPFTVWPTALDDDVFKMLTMDLIPSFKELHERHTLVQHVIECYKAALRNVIPGRFDVKFCIVGSVQTRTCLPDGDIDVAVFVYPHQDCPYNKTLAEAMRSNIHLLGADLMARARDHMSVVDHSIHVESLVFAEVRVLKLVVNGTNIDLTAGQIGGYTTSAFIAEVDHFIGHEHRFRYALMLVKAWCLHDAHIIGGAGGYLSTYAVATILIAVFNQLFRENAPSRELQPLRVLLHFLRYCSEFDFEHHVLSIYGPIPIANVHRFVDELPTAPTNHMVYRCRVGHRLVQKCLRKFSGILNPESQASQQSPTPPHSAFSPSPSGTATPPHATNATSFPLRPMNIMDPLKPVNNLTRGVNLSHMHRLGTVFRRGRDVLTRLVERHADEPMRVIETFFKGVLNEVSKWPPSDRTVPDGAAMAKCQRCSRPTIFCTDMDYMERMGIGVTSPPTEPTDKTAYGYLVSRDFQRASAQQVQQQHQQPPLMPLTQGHARAPHSGYNIPAGHHAMPQYVQSPQQTLLPHHHHHHHQHHAHAYRGSPGAGAVGQQPYYHPSPHQHHHHHHHQGMTTHAGPLPPPALTAPNNNNTNSHNKPRSSPNGPTGGHPMPLQHSSPAQQHTSPPGAWGQAPPSASAQGSRGPSTAVGSSTYGVSRPHHDRGNSGGGGGFATHVAHQTPRDLDSYRRNSASAAGISSAGSNGQQLPAPAHPSSTGSSPPVTSAAPNRAAYQPPHARKSDTSPVPTSDNSQARR